MLASDQRTYEAWITASAGSMMTRVVEIKASSDRDAYRKAKELLVGDEILRGVTEIEP